MDTDLPKAIASNTLRIGSVDLKVHVLDNGQRVLEAASVAEFFNWLADADTFTEADAERVAKFVRGATIESGDQLCFTTKE